MFFQLATGYAGVWYGIDPFDQPGVELGKQAHLRGHGAARLRGAPRARGARSADEVVSVAARVDVFDAPPVPAYLYQTC